MTTARLRNRIEAVESKAGGSADDEYRLFWVSGGSGRGDGGHEGDLSEFLADQGHDMSYGKIRILHVCPHWDGVTKTFTPAPLRDRTTEHMGVQAARAS